MSQRIGIVLAEAPKYSETFFWIKIEALKSLGFEAILYLDSKSYKSSINGITVSSLPNLTKGKFANVVTLICTILPCILIAPKRTIKFVTLSLQNGIVLRRLILNLFKSSKLLQSELDWIHFGFGTLGLGREFIGVATDTRLAASFRGFDLSVYPIGKTNVYNELFKYLNKTHFISDSLFEKAKMLSFEGNYEIIIPATNLVVSNVRECPKIERNKEIHIITVARLHWVKGLDYSIQAVCKLIKEHGLNIRYTIIGGGDDMERLKYLAYLYDIDKSIKFVGVKSKQDTQDLLGMADIYLQYSLSEGYCNAVIEAQAKRILCIASNVGGLSENIEDGYSGYLVDPLNPTMLSEKILEIIESDMRVIEKVRKKATANVVDKSNFAAHKDAWNSFYSE